MEPGRTCPHLSEIREVEPSSPDSCLQCVEAGDSWVYLRICLTCGDVGCCDNSPNQHATRHHHATGHPVIQGYEPGETWQYCYPDDELFEDAGAPIRR